MEPSTSAAHANTNNGMADGIFSNLRNQLDQIQATANRPADGNNMDTNLGWRDRAMVNHDRDVAADEEEPAEANMGWRQRAMVNHQRDVVRTGANRRVENNPRLYGHVRSNRTA